MKLSDFFLLNLVADEEDDELLWEMARELLALRKVAREAEDLPWNTSELKWPWVRELIAAIKAWKDLCTS